MSDDLTLALGRLSTVLEWKSEAYEVTRNHTPHRPFRTCFLILVLPHPHRTATTPLLTLPPVLRVPSPVPVLQTTGTGPMMQSPIVRGAPYTSMIYKSATPRITVERPIIFNPVVDNDPSKEIVCGTGDGVFSSTPVRVEKEIKVWSAVCLLYFHAQCGCTFHLRPLLP